MTDIVTTLVGWGIILLVIILIVRGKKRRPHRDDDDSYESAPTRKFTYAELKANPDRYVCYEKTGKVFEINSDGSVTEVGVLDPEAPEAPQPKVAPPPEASVPQVLPCRAGFFIADYAGKPRAVGGLNGGTRYPCRKEMQVPVNRGQRLMFVIGNDIVVQDVLRLASLPSDGNTFTVAVHVLPDARVQLHISTADTSRTVNLGNQFVF